jgi:hypothetical protein
VLFQDPKLIFVIFAFTSQFSRPPCCYLYCGRIRIWSCCVLQWRKVYTEFCETRLADSTAEMARLSLSLSLSLTHSCTVFSYAFLFKEWKWSKKERIRCRWEGEEMEKGGREKQIRGENILQILNFRNYKFNFLTKSSIHALCTYIYICYFVDQLMK